MGGRVTGREIPGARTTNRAVFLSLPLYHTVFLLSPQERFRKGMLAFSLRFENMFLILAFYSLCLDRIGENGLKLENVWENFPMARTGLRRTTTSTGDGGRMEKAPPGGSFPTN